MKNIISLLQKYRHQNYWFTKIILEMIIKQKAYLYQNNSIIGDWYHIFHKIKAFPCISKLCLGLIRYSSSCSGRVSQLFRQFCIRYNMFHLDIDECSDEIHACDSNTATCSNTQGSYRCLCKPGYDQNNGRKCTGKWSNFI